MCGRRQKMDKQDKQDEDNFTKQFVAILMKQYRQSISENTKRGIALAKKNKTGRYAKDN